jgi:hypothetical protein
LLNLGKGELEQEERERRLNRLTTLEEGRDELNFAEFPLSAICDRFLDGEKTVVFEDTVWDEEKRKRLPRKLTISGSDRFGLPTAKDDDVLLACIQLSSLGDFHEREVHFSRYELLKLLRWPDETRYYRRLAMSLRRWKGLTIYSDRAFYDKARKSWVNKDFGIFDNLYIYERDEEDGRAARADSWFAWNEVVYGSFQAGYLKKLDWDLYLRLNDPVAKRLYRFLDKRFYHSDRLVIDLDELAFRKVRVSGNYNTAQVKRALMKGIRELEHLWELRPAPAEERFQKVSRGKWEAVFVKRRRRKAQAALEKREPSHLANELTKRGVGPAVAEELVEGQSAERIETMLELFDWHNAKGEERGPGFLVAGIRSAQPYALPKGFQTKAEAARKHADREAARRAELARAKGRQEKETVHAKAVDRPFQNFWNTLAADEQEAFFAEALQRADRTKRDGYRRLEPIGGPVLDQYRQLILLDHFRRRALPAT